MLATPPLVFSSVFHNGPADVTTDRKIKSLAIVTRLNETNFRKDLKQLNMIGDNFVIFKMSHLMQQDVWN